MIRPITIERWQEAQEAERELHTMSLEEGIHHYRIAYGHNFRYLGIDPDDPKHNIIEIGCADFPALRYCNCFPDCLIVEPMPSSELLNFGFKSGINVLNIPFEKLDSPFLSVYEIWMFNVLQHTIDPELFIKIAKQAKIIRYFEPIETEITDYHPHSFTKDDFDRWFGDANKYYNENTNQCFHDGPCCYGVYKSGV